MEEKIQPIEEHIEPRQANWLIFTTLMLYIGISVIIGVLGVLFGQSIPFLRNTMLSYFAGQAAILLPSLFFVKQKNLKFGKFVRFKGLHPITIILLPVFTIAIYPVISLCSYISLLFSDNVISGKVNEFLVCYPVWFCVLMLAIVPCLVEEIVFRGVLYQSYRSAGVVKAGICTAVLFGLFHMNFNQMSYAIAIGILFIVLNEATGSIVSSMIVHCMINGVSVIASSIQARMGETADTQVMQNNMTSVTIVILNLIILSVFGLVFAFGILWAMVCLEKRTDKIKEMFQKKEKRAEKICSPVLLVTAFICIIMIVAEQLI